MSNVPVPILETVSILGTRVEIVTDVGKEIMVQHKRNAAQKGSVDVTLAKDLIHVLAMTV